MNDEILEQRLRRWYRTEVDADPMAPAALRASVMEVPLHVGGRRGKAVRSWTLLAAAALMGAILASAAFVVSSNILHVATTATPLPTVSLVPPTPSPTSTPTPEPTATGAPTASVAPTEAPANVVAVFHLVGDTAEILTIDPATGERVRVATVPVALVPLGKNVFADTLGPGWAGLVFSDDRRLITILAPSDGSMINGQLNLATGQLQTVDLRDEAYVAPDGKSAAIVAADPAALQIVDLGGGLLQQVALPDRNYFSRVNWASDGSELVLAGFDFLGGGVPDSSSANGQAFANTAAGPSSEYIVPLTGGSVHAFGPFLEFGVLTGELSPDRSTIVTETDCGTDNPRSCTGGLVRIDVASGDTSNLTTSQDDIDPQWSPDGTRIAFTNTSRQQRGVWVMNADGSGLTRLTAPDRPAVDHDIAWSPDGSALVFTRGTYTTFGHLGDVYVVPVVGGEPKLLISDSIADW